MALSLLLANDISDEVLEEEKSSEVRVETVLNCPRGYRMSEPGKGGASSA